MILRIFRGRAPASARERLLDHVRDAIYPANLRTPGLRSFQAGVRDADAGGIELVLVSTWTDIPTLLLGVGDPLRPRWLEAVEGEIEAASADHYELVGEDVRGVVPLDGAVVRVFTGTLDPRTGEAFFSFARQAQAEQLDSGLILASHLGRRLDDAGEEAAFVTVWRDAAGPRSFGGSASAPANRDAWQPYFSAWSFAAYDAIARVPPGSAAIPPILLLDSDRRYLFATPAAGDVLGRPVARLVGLRVDDVTSPAEQAGLDARWQRFLATGSDEGQFEIERGDGRLVPVRYTARTNTPWPGVHASTFGNDDTAEALDLDEALGLAGIVARYAVDEA